MVAFFGLWAIAIPLVLRWFHVVTTNRAWDDEPTVDLTQSEPLAIYPRLSSVLFDLSQVPAE
jgi:hypothetical protein